MIKAIYEEDVLTLDLFFVNKGRYEAILNNLLLGLKE